MPEPKPAPARVSTTNYEKFQTSNPVVRRLIDRFYGAVREVVEPLGARTVLDAGCGEGETLERLAGVLPAGPSGIDLNPDSVGYASERLPGADLKVADLLSMPFEDGSFELVLCLEVLEHLRAPERGLAELSRVCARDLVVSVPHEPWFRLGSLARGKYVSTWGNHPEHLNHWAPASLRDFLERQVDVVSLRRSAPWLIAHCRPRP